MQTARTIRRWRRAEYERLVSLGVFEGEPLEVYRESKPDGTAPFGWRFRLARRLWSPATVTLVALPAVRLAACARRGAVEEIE